MTVYTHYLSLATEKFTGGSIGWVRGKEILNLVPDQGIIDLDWTGPGPGLEPDKKKQYFDVHKFKIRNSIFNNGITQVLSINLI